MAEKEFVPRGKEIIMCATKSCLRVANFRSIAEGNILGANAPQRCYVCCNAIGDAIDLFIDHYHFQRKAPANPDKNIWGTLKSRINADEYCIECEHVVPGHFDACPIKRKTELVGES